VPVPVGRVSRQGSGCGAGDRTAPGYRVVVSDTEWFVCPLEPRVRHLVTTVGKVGVPLPALCLVESPAWHPLSDTDGTSDPCPLCAAAAADRAGRSRRANGARSDVARVPWGQPGDVRGR
jgi:hypothetical protein